MSRQEAVALECSVALTKALDGLHEISQPLTTLCLGLHLLELAEGEYERSRLLTSIQNECNRVVQGVQHLRDLLEPGLTISPWPRATSALVLRDERRDA